MPQGSVADLLSNKVDAGASETRFGSETSSMRLLENAFATSMGTSAARAAASRKQYPTGL